MVHICSFWTTFPAVFYLSKVMFVIRMGIWIEYAPEIVDLSTDPMNYISDQGSSYIFLLW